jgi:hypothetical protein
MNAYERFEKRLNTYSLWIKQEKGLSYPDSTKLLGSLFQHFRAFIELEYNKPIDELNSEDLSLEDLKLAAYGGWAWGWSNDADFQKSSRYKAYLFRPKQREFWYAPVIFPAYVGAWRSGKTVICCLKGLWLSKTYPGTKGIVVRNTYPELMDTTVSSFIKIFDYFEWEEGKEYRHKIGDKKILIKAAEKVDSIIDYRPAREQNETLDSAVSRFKGYEPDWGLISEASDVDEKLVLTLFGRRGQWGKITPENNIYGKDYYRPYHKCIMVESNPPDDEHYLFKRYVKKELKDGEKIKENMANQHYLIMASTYENKRNLDPDYIKSLEAMDEIWKRQYLYGQWGYVPLEGEPIYNFRYETYVRKDFLKYHPELPMIRGWDLGATDKWKACIVCQLDPKGILLVLAEIIRAEPGIEQFGRLVQRQCNLLFPEIKNWKDIADPVACTVKSQTDMKSAADILRPLGIHLIAGEAGFDIRRDAVVQVMSRLVDGFPGMLISEPNCRTLVKGFMGNYRYKIVRSDTGQFSRTPVNDMYAHVQTALQYLCTRLGYANVKRMKDMLNKIKKKNPDIYSKQKEKAYRNMMNR